MSDPRVNQEPKIILPPQRTYTLSPTEMPAGSVRDVSAYAVDLASWGNSHKHKFLFITEIELNPQYSDILDTTRFALLAQTATRPKIQFDHLEYPQYGIKKGVHTKTTFQPIQLSFVDDNKNSVMQFFTNVMRVLSPITNIDNSAVISANQYNFKTNKGTFTNINTTLRGIEIQESQIGSNKPNVYAQSAGYPGSNHTTNDSTSPTSIFSNVKIHHVHLFGAGVNTYTFHNPRLLSMDLDDLDMAASNDISVMKMSVAYDYLTASTGEMTATISNLVGYDANYHIRRDLK